MIHSNDPSHPNYPPRRQHSLNLHATVPVMGWNSSCVLINQAEAGYLGGTLAHDSARAAQLASDLGYRGYASAGPTTLRDAIFPDSLCIGAYEKGGIVGDMSLYESFDFEAGEPGPVAARLVELFPQARILVIILHGATNFWAYLDYDNGVCRRAFGGDAETGVAFDRGQPLPAEKPYLDRAYESDGILYVRRTAAEIALNDTDWTIDEIAPSIASSLAEPFFGRPLDDDHLHWNTPMEQFQRPARSQTPWSWKRLFGG